MEKINFSELEGYYESIMELCNIINKMNANGITKKTAFASVYPLGIIVGVYDEDSSGKLHKIYSSDINVPESFQETTDKLNEFITKMGRGTANG